MQTETVQTETVQTETDPSTISAFSVKGTQLLSAGQSMALLARTPRLWIHVKVYAEGGENGLHAHTDEDHAFFILEGEATFVHPDGSTRVVGANEGLMIPRGGAYAFRSTGGTNLVMLRIGADASDAVVAAAVDQEHDTDQLANPWPRAQTHRVHPDGSSFAATDSANRGGAVDGVPIPGAVFGG